MWGFEKAIKGRPGRVVIANIVKDSDSDVHAVDIVLARMVWLAGDPFPFPEPEGVIETEMFESGKEALEWADSRLTEIAARG